MLGRARDVENQLANPRRSYDSAPSHDNPSALCWEPGDPENPFNWSLKKRWIVTLTACFVTLIVGVNGTAIASAAEEINERFGVSDSGFPNSYWPITSWTLGGAFMPLFALPLLEAFGVRYGYLLTYAVFTLFIIPQAVCQKYATLIVTRIFSGGCAAVLQNITGGIIGDIWHGPQSRSLPVAFFIFAYLGGVTVGPVVGTAIVHKLYWRWIFYIQLVFYGACFPILITILPETRGAVILKRRAKQTRKQKGEEACGDLDPQSPTLSQRINEAIFRPMHLLLTEWVVFQSVAQTFSANYGFSTSSTGYVQVAVVIGELLGLLATPMQDRLYLRSALHNTESPGKPIPEARLYFSIPASFLGLAGGFLWYAWSNHSSLHWILPTVGLGLVGFGIMSVTTAVGNYLTDAYAKYAASAIAGIAFGENAFAATLPLASQTMYSTLGFQWASSLLGFVALLLSFVPVVLLVLGRKIRARSPFIGEAAQE